MGETWPQPAIGDVRALARDRQVEVLVAGDEVRPARLPELDRAIPGYDPLNLP